MKRGDVFLGVLEPRSGSEQGGTRPVILVSHDSFNQAARWRSVIVVPVTTSDSTATRRSTAIPLAAGDGGLDMDSVAICHQVTTLSREKLIRRLGALGAVSIARIERGLRAALDLD